MNSDTRIYVAGHRGLVGSAVVARLQKAGYTNLITRTSSEVDLRNQADVTRFFAEVKPDVVMLCAARVGGILANNTYPAQFIYDNLMIAANMIHASYEQGAKKLVNLGSSCIYPKFATQPMSEDQLLTGPLEPTNEAYAIAKISAIKLCRYYNEQYGTDFVSAMPTNLYGPHDNFDLETSHVLPAMIRKFHEAKEARKRGEDAAVVLWGDGSPRREFLHVHDLADALVYLMEHGSYSEIGEFVNVGTGEDIPIQDLAALIARIVGYEGPVEWDSSKPNGTPRKLLDVSRLESLGWTAQTSLEDGIRDTYRWFLDNETAPTA